MMVRLHFDDAYVHFESTGQAINYAFKFKIYQFIFNYHNNFEHRSHLYGQNI